jgi:hypothetical protein
MPKICCGRKTSDVREMLVGRSNFLYLKVNAVIEGSYLANLEALKYWATKVGLNSVVSGNSLKISRVKIDFKEDIYGRKEKNRGDKLICIIIHNTWKCHNETPCITILYKQNVFFQKQRIRK